MSSSPTPLCDPGALDVVRLLESAAEAARRHRLDVGLIFRALPSGGFYMSLRQLAAVLGLDVDNEGERCALLSTIGLGLPTDIGKTFADGRALYFRRPGGRARR